MSNGVIQIDPRTGSKELLPLFTRGRAVISTCDLPADFAFMGNGPNGPCMVGFERKTLVEFLSDYERFAANQLVPLVNSYQFAHLIIEGPMQTTADHRIQRWERGRWQDTTPDSKRPVFKTMWGRAYTLIRRMNVTIIPTTSALHTAQVIESCYNWFQRAWDEHESYNVEYTAPPPFAMPRMPTILEKMLVQIPGVGWTKAIALAERYKTLSALLAVPEANLAEERINGRVLGRKSANTIKQFIK